jgi:hypothetical protein
MATEAPKTDTIMLFNITEGKPVDAECTLLIDNDDALIKGYGFKAADESDPRSTFFQVHDFEFGMSLKENDNKETGQATSQITADTGAYAQWRSAAGDSYKKIEYPLEFDKFSFKRTIDCASPVLFERCCQSLSFHSAVLIKRMAQGGDLGSVAVMRAVFTKVLVTGIDWSDGELIQENVDFICQQMEITLIPQTAGGAVAKDKQFSLSWKPGADGSRGKKILKIG